MNDKRSRRHVRRSVTRSIRWAVALLVMAGLADAPTARADVGTATEQKVKVAYLYNFLRYVRWPETAYTDEASPMVIGIIDGDPHARLLNQVAAKKKARGRQIVVREFDSVGVIQACHLVFLHAGIPAADEAEAIRRTEQQKSLLICESARGTQPGVPIRFFTDRDGTIGLRINLDAMARRGLQADAKLLNIATIQRD
ncbi:YfiR family protein [Stieleria mannarensis]|uniref:YfiR family protein n=1 Tax=Stieleria mannarensis TaxID=2755585 RepID=UPI0015FF340E|nr:YfiR family protein [Rhodopirellula sp. JC639]